jgi:hypothetical protein
MGFPLNRPKQALQDIGVYFQSLKNHRVLRIINTEEHGVFVTIGSSYSFLRDLRGGFSPKSSNSVVI